jgi:hypothetical protein
MSPAKQTARTLAAKHLKIARLHFSSAWDSFRLALYWWRVSREVK